MYKAKIRGLNSEFDYSQYSIALPISVGQPYHNSDKLTAILKLIEKRFSCCDIIIADTLQRLNLAIKYNYSETEAYSKSYDLGTEWLLGNKDVFKAFNICRDIIRWDNCTQHRNYNTILEDINHIYGTNNEYKVALNHDINIFLARLKKQVDNHLAISAWEYCYNYLMEETAVFYSFFVEKNYPLLLYPSNIPRSIELLRKYFLAPPEKDSLKNFLVYFKKTG